MQSDTLHTGSSSLQLRPYQVEGVSWLLEHSQGLLADPMGVGKTVQAVAALRVLKPKTVLVVAPKTVLLSWIRHIKEWWPDHPRGHLLQGSKSKRYEKMMKWHKHGGILVLNYELLKDLEAIHRPVDVVIFDEAHRVKGRRAKVHKRAKRWARSSEYVWMLTGTPLVRGPEDLVALRHVITGGREAYWKLVNKYFITEPNFWGGVKLARVANKEAMRQWLSTWMLRRDKLEVLPGLPPMQRIPVDIELEREIRDIYVQLEKELYLAIEDGFDIALANQLSAIAKLRQLLLSPKLIHPSLPEGNSIQWLQDFLKDSQPPAVVYSPFKKALKLLVETTGVGEVLSGDVSGSKRQKLIEDFNAGKIPLLAVSVTMAEGFELPAARAVVFWGFDWNATTHEQAEARVHRIGFQHDFLPIYYLRHPKTIDIHVLSIVNRKYTWQQALMGKTADQKHLDFTQKNPL